MSLGLQSVYQLDVILCFEVFAAILVELEFSCAAFALNCVFRPWLSWTPGTSIVVASHCDVTIAFLLRDWSIHCQDAQRRYKAHSVEIRSQMKIDVIWEASWLGRTLKNFTVVTWDSAPKRTCSL